MRVLVAAAVLTLLMNQTAKSQMIIAHRGASADAPENTLAAFREAWRQNADGIEGDFYFTTDQQIVCIHDRDTQRTAGTKLNVKAASLSDLQKLEYGKWFSPEFAGEPLPTFTDVLESVPEGKLFVVELKTGPEIVPLMVEQLNESEFPLDSILIISFDEHTVAKAKQMLPEVRAHWLTGFKETSKGSGKYKPDEQQLLAKFRMSRADGIGFQGVRQVLTPDFLTKLRAEGVPEFHVWTIDDPEDARYFRELGAKAITTNRPASIRESLPPIPGG